MNCEICGDINMAIRWTDTHGIGACLICGAPYHVYFYDHQGKMVNKPMELLVLEPWIVLIKKYWNETKHNVAPGEFNIPGSSYEMANKEDFEMFKTWMEAHKEEWPKEVEVEDVTQ